MAWPEGTITHERCGSSFTRKITGRQDNLVRSGGHYNAQCQACGEWVKVELARDQPAAGQPLALTATDTAAPPPVNQNRPRSAPSDSASTALGCVLLVGLLVSVPLLIWAGLTGRISLPDTGTDEAGARVICEDFVKRTLTWPETADFSDAQATKTGDLTWTVTGTVAAEGDLVGQKFRSHYACSVKYRGDNKWVLTEDLQVG